MFLALFSKFCSEVKISFYLEKISFKCLAFVLRFETCLSESKSIFLIYIRFFFRRYSIFQKRHLATRAPHAHSCLAALSIIISINLGFSLSKKRVNILLNNNVMKLKTGRKFSFSENIHISNSETPKP